MSFEGDLATIFVNLRADAQLVGNREEMIIQASKQYRKVIVEYSSEMLPIWHAIELLVFRAHSSVGASSEITWFEFGMAFSGFYKQYYYQIHADPVRRVIARDFESLGLECPPGDLRSAQHYLSQWNRWRQLAASETSDGDLRAIFGGIDYERITSFYKLNWLEQALLSLMFYEDRMERDNWESLYMLIEKCKDQSTLPTLELVKMVLSGKLLT
jgi:hypothetical protein